MPEPHPSRPLTGLIDYGAGNLQSVNNALLSLGESARIVRTPADLEGISRLILPGVGSFGDCAANLDAQDLRNPILQWLRKGRPYLGICLGYQILFEESAESPGVAGLGFLAGRVERFAPHAGLKVPHMGWNTAEPTDPSHPMWRSLGDDSPPWFYFVHSFFPVPGDPHVVASHTLYGAPFASAIATGGLWAVQFHPERSQDNGLTLLRNFLDHTKAPSPGYETPSRVP